MSVCDLLRAGTSEETYKASKGRRRVKGKMLSKHVVSGNSQLGLIHETPEDTYSRIVLP